MDHPFYFTHSVLKAGYSLTSHRHQFYKIKYHVTKSPKNLQIELIHLINVVKHYFNIYPRLISQSKLKYQTVFSARFFKQHADYRVPDETELYIILNFDRNLTLSDIGRIDNRSQLEKQVRIQEMKKSGWR